MNDVPETDAETGSEAGDETLDRQILPLLPLTTGVVLPSMVVTIALESDEARAAASESALCARSAEARSGSTERPTTAIRFAIGIATSAATDGLPTSTFSSARRRNADSSGRHRVLSLGVEAVLGGVNRADIVQRPLLKRMDRLAQGMAEFGQFVVDPRRDGRSHGPADEAIAFEPA